ncbi:hypothetical protein SNEBB_003350, partial [Seison nebaliae]
MNSTATSTAGILRELPENEKTATAIDPATIKAEAPIMQSKADTDAQFGTTNGLIAPAVPPTSTGAAAGDATTAAGDATTAAGDATTAPGDATTAAGGATTAPGGATTAPGGGTTTAG